VAHLKPYSVAHGQYTTESTPLKLEFRGTLTHAPHNIIFKNFKKICILEMHAAQMQKFDIYPS
jgi:hypothetical protein